MENFVSWYRYIFPENQNKLTQLTQSLQEILDGFISFKLEPISEKAVILKLIFKTEESEQNIEYTFEELSDGQKVLVVLYSLFGKKRGRLFDHETSSHLQHFGRLNDDGRFALRRNRTATEHRPEKPESAHWQLSSECSVA